MKMKMLVGVLTGTLVLLCLCIRGVVGAAAPMSKVAQSSSLPVPAVPSAQQRTLTNETSFTLYGPRRFDRAAGPPRTVVEKFDLPADALAPYTIQVQNGAPDGAGRVSSATINLNGSDVFRPSDFNPHVPSVERTVMLRTTNTLEVRIASAPGSFLIVTLKAIRARLIVVPDLPDPAALTMQAFPNPSGLPNIQLRALLIRRDGSSQDVATQVTWASSDPAIGEVDVAGFFRGLGQGRTFITATLGTTTSPPLLIQTALIVKAASTNSAAEAMQEGITSTDDPELRSGIDALITFELGPLGLATGAFRGVFPSTHFHEMGLNAGGVRIPGDSAMAVPGLNYNRNNPLDITQWATVYDGNLHIIFKPAISADLKSRKFRGGDFLNNAARAAIHELLHAIIFRDGIDAGPYAEEELTVAAVESLIGITIWHLHHDPRGCRTISELRKDFPRLQRRKGAAALLERLGIVDNNPPDGLPDQIRTDMCAILQGTVTNAMTGAPIESATVDTEEKQTTTNAFGDYLLTDLTAFPLGRPYRVTATASGFQPSTTNVILAPGAVTTQDFALTPPPVLSFVQIAITISVGNAGGNVRSTPAGINCTRARGGQTGECVAPFAPGTRVTLEATPDPNSFFIAWSRVPNCGTNPRCDVTVGPGGTSTVVVAGFGLRLP